MAAARGRARAAKAAPPAAAPRFRRLRTPPEQASAPVAVKKQADDSHFIGDTRVKVSGEIQAGGSVDTRK